MSRIMLMGWSREAGDQDQTEAAQSQNADYPQLGCILLHGP
jgi:hypothetical protein